jgi:hypothetical protein
VKKTKYDLKNHPPHPDTLPDGLADKSIEQLEQTLVEAEQRQLDAEMNAADEKGLKQLSTYGGATLAAAMISASLAKAPSSLITLLGSVGLISLIFGYLGLRYASRSVALQSRTKDVDRIKRFIEQYHMKSSSTSKETTNQPATNNDPDE